MSGVKLVAVHKDVLRIFLSDEVAGSTFSAIEALWEPIKELDLNRRLEVDFSCEHEAYTGRSDYLYWSAVKEVLESNRLGIEEYETPVLHDCTDEARHEDSLESHALHVDALKSFATHAAARYGICPRGSSMAAMIGHSASLMTEYYADPAHRKPIA
jgi:hypothetical protein